MKSESEKRETVDLFFRDWSAHIHWFDALWRMLELSELRPTALPKTSAVAKFRRAAEIVRIHLSFECIRQSPPSSPPVDFASWGRLFFIAWIGQKVDFFEDLARVSRTMAGIHKADKICGDAVELMVLRAAYDLAERLRRDPSRDEVIEECQRLGIRVGHWGKTLKRCKLGFLKGASRGRPKVKKKTRTKK